MNLFLFRTSMFSGSSSAFYILLLYSLSTSALDNFACPVHPIDRIISAKSAIFGHSCYMFVNVRCLGAFPSPSVVFSCRVLTIARVGAKRIPPKSGFAVLYILDVFRIVSCVLFLYKTACAKLGTSLALFICGGSLRRNRHKCSITGTSGTSGLVAWRHKTYRLFRRKNAIPIQSITYAQNSLYELVENYYLQL